MSVDHDGKFRMDCSSPYAMASLIGLKDRYRVAFANDPDSDRHGTVTPAAGLINPNHYLSVAILYLLTHRPDRPINAATGKTLVSSRMIDRVARKRGCRLSEVPVGFKWFAPGLFGSYCFGGEERAGASLRHDGAHGQPTRKVRSWICWPQRSPPAPAAGEHYHALIAEFGAAHYARIDAPATQEQNARLAGLSAESVNEPNLASEPILAKLTRTPGNRAPIGGINVVARSSFAVRPSGTEAVYTIYEESFKDEQRLQTIVMEAEQIVAMVRPARAEIRGRVSAKEVAK
jgi:phosphoglucomutase